MEKKNFLRTFWLYKFVQTITGILTSEWSMQTSDIKILMIIASSVHFIPLNRKYGRKF